VLTHDKRLGHTQIDDALRGPRSKVASDGDVERTTRRGHDGWDDAKAWPLELEEHRDPLTDVEGGPAVIRAQVERAGWKAGRAVRVRPRRPPRSTPCEDAIMNDRVGGLLVTIDLPIA